MYLIIGASSFIGRHLYDYCHKEGIDVLGTYFTHSYRADWIKFDLCVNNLEDIACHKFLQRKNIDVVIICGANTSIDSCKTNENASRHLNVVGTQRILRQADEMGIKSIFLSSEAVFDGKKGMYAEEERPNPITVYGKQKWQVEQYIMQNLKNYIIFRVSRAVGSQYGERDIFHEFYSKIINHEEIVCLKNQSFCITEVDDIAQYIIKALEQDIFGLYHISSTNYISRFELAKLYAEKMFGGYNKIIEKEYDDIPFLDNRHIYGGLNGEKLAGLLNAQFSNTMQILDRYIDTYKMKNTFKGGQNND